MSYKDPDSKNNTKVSSSDASNDEIYEPVFETVVGEDKVERLRLVETLFITLPSLAQDEEDEDRVTEVNLRIPVGVTIAADTAPWYWRSNLILEHYGKSPAKNYKAKASEWSLRVFLIDSKAYHKKIFALPLSEPEASPPSLSPAAPLVDTQRPSKSKSSIIGSLWDRVRLWIF